MREFRKVMVLPSKHLPKERSVTLKVREEDVNKGRRMVI